MKKSKDELAKNQIAFDLESLEQKPTLHTFILRQAPKAHWKLFKDHLFMFSLQKILKIRFSVNDMHHCQR